MNFKRQHIFIFFLILILAVIFVWGRPAGRFARSFLAEGVTGSSNQINAVDQVEFLEDGSVLAPVYSSYPFNLKNELIIAAGSDSGIGVGDAALSQGYLIGRVSEINSKSAIIQTVFDSRFQIPVRIGSRETDSLMRGGNDPELTLIDIGAEVGEGDEVRAAAEGIPYGLLLGNLIGLRDSSDKVFREASLGVHVNPGTLKQVVIVPHQFL